MLPKLSRPSAPMVVSVAALVVALGGTSYAAAKIGTRDLEKDAVISSKIDNGTVRSADIENGSIRGGDLSPSAKVSGPRGPAGADGMDGADGTGRWALIGTDGQIVSQSGGFTLVAGYPVLPDTSVPPAPDNSLRANGNVYLNANEDLSDNGFVATVVLQNTTDLNGDGVTSGRAGGADANPEFSGEIAVSRCNVGAPTTPPSGPTNCAPSGAQNATSFVVSPRMSDGSVTTGLGTPADPGTRKAFYVILTGDSSDFVAPSSR